MDEELITIWLDYCPVCKMNSLSAGLFVADDWGGSRVMTCKSCDYRWKENYVFASNEEVEKV